MRIIVENFTTGQRISVEAEAFDDPEAHPINHDHIDYSQSFPTEGGPAQPLETPHDGRKGFARRSLKAEGFVPTHYQDEYSQETPIFSRVFTDQEKAATTPDEVKLWVEQALERIAAKRASS